jgi:hypothetical protein
MAIVQFTAQKAVVSTAVITIHYLKPPINQYLANSLDIDIAKLLMIGYHAPH